MSGCKHEEFSAATRVNRLEDRGIFLLELEVQCSQCKESFHFCGLEMGLSLSGGAMCSVDQTELRVRIAPGAVNPMAAATESLQ